MKQSSITPLLTKSYIHSVLTRCHFFSTKLPDAHITALVFLPHVADDDASPEVAAVAHTRGQRSPVACLQRQEGDLRVSHEAGDGAVFTLAYQDVVHHGALEDALRVWVEMLYCVMVFDLHTEQVHISPPHLVNPPFTYTKMELCSMVLLLTHM